MAKALPEPEDDRDRKLLADIARVGWAVIGIPEDDEGPGYAFSVGLYRTFGHPEVILIGLPWKLSYRFINDIGAAVKAGKQYEPGREYDDLVEGYPAVFVAVDRGHYKEYLGTAGWFYRGWDFPVVQMVWCDRDRCWPWDAGKAPKYWRRQPLLGIHAKPRAAPDRGGT
jgi:hypothetical protein